MNIEHCELCKKPLIGYPVILPIHQSETKLDTCVCEECAKKSAAYCAKHSRPHTGFMDGTTACLRCVEEKAISARKTAPMVYEHITRVLSDADIEDLDTAIRLNADAWRSSEDLVLLRLVYTKMARSGKKYDEVMSEITESGSAKAILCI